MRTGSAKSKLGPEAKIARWKRGLRERAGRASAQWVAVYRAKSPDERARILARMLVGYYRYRARQHGWPEPEFTTFDAEYSEGKGVVKKSKLRKFDL